MTRPTPISESVFVSAGFPAVSRRRNRSGTAGRPTDKDGSLTRAEFKSAFEKWSVDFDTDMNGALSQEELLAGLNPALPRPNFGPRQAAPDDNNGFIQVFDGKSLDGWDGDPKIWRAENGEIIGETTVENPIKVNTFSESAVQKIVSSPRPSRRSSRNST